MSTVMPRRNVRTLRRISACAEATATKRPRAEGSATAR